MPAAGNAHVAGEQSVLNFAVGHGDPTSVDQHLYADRRYLERCGRTVDFVAARRPFAIHQMRVDVVGGGRLRADTARGVSRSARLTICLMASRVEKIVRT